MGAARFLRSMLGSGSAAQKQQQQEHGPDKRNSSFSSAFLHWSHRGGVSKEASRHANDDRSTRSTVSQLANDDRSIRSTVSQVGIFELSGHGGNAWAATDAALLQQQQVAQQRPLLPPEVAAAAQQLRGLLASTSFFQHKLQCDTAEAIRTISLAAALAATAGNAAPTTTPAAAAAAAAAGGTAARLWPAAVPLDAPARSGAAAAAPFAAKVALRLSYERGYRVVLRKVLDSKAYWTKAMENIFLVVLDPNASAACASAVEYIVDPHFKELFKIASMSEAYAALWAALPAAFVGTPMQLAPVVMVLSEEVCRSFAVTGRPCPPWRSGAATVNRWMSNGCCDVAVPGPGATPAEMESFLIACSQLVGGGSAAASSVNGSAGSSAARASGAVPVPSRGCDAQGSSAAIARRPCAGGAAGLRTQSQPLVSVRGFSPSEADAAAVLRTISASAAGSSGSEAHHQQHQQHQHKQQGSQEDDQQHHQQHHQQQHQHKHKRQGSQPRESQQVEPQLQQRQQLEQHWNGSGRPAGDHAGSQTPSHPQASQAAAALPALPHLQTARLLTEPAGGHDAAIGSPCSSSRYSEELGVLYSSDSGSGGGEYDSLAAQDDVDCVLAVEEGDAVLSGDGAAAGLQRFSYVADALPPHARQQAWLSAQAASVRDAAAHDADVVACCSVSASEASFAGSGRSEQHLGSPRVPCSCQAAGDVPTKAVCSCGSRASAASSASPRSGMSSPRSASFTRPRSLLTAKLQELRHQGSGGAAQQLLGQGQPWQAQGSAALLQQRRQQQLAMQMGGAVQQQYHQQRQQQQQSSWFKRFLPAKSEQGL